MHMSHYIPHEQATDKRNLYVTVQFSAVVVDQQTLDRAKVSCSAVEERQPQDKRAISVTVVNKSDRYWFIAIFCVLVMMY
jgi:predicted secreted protein